MTVVLVVCFPVLVVPHAERVPGAELQVRSLTDGKIDSGADLDTPALLGGSLGRGCVVVVVKSSQRTCDFPDFTGISSLQSSNAERGDSQGNNFPVHNLILISTLNIPNGQQG